ncbi:hypothetical protein FRC03_003565 [Tulasnella sp. 419]|nr:hypothetical protein FRC03_003565 [Tulasnella sp. 419]
MRGPNHMVGDAGFYCLLDHSDPAKCQKLNPVSTPIAQPSNVPRSKRNPKKRLPKRKGPLTKKQLLAERYAQNSEYYREPQGSESNAASTQENEPRGTLSRGFSSAWINETIATRWNQESASSQSDPLSDLNKYLSDNLEQTHGVVAWWGGSAIPCERTLSSAGLTGTDRRDRLNVVTFEALQILKDGYKSGRVISNPEEPTVMGGESDEEEMDFLMQFTPQVLVAP